MTKIQPDEWQHLAHRYHEFHDAQIDRIALIRDPNAKVYSFELQLTARIENTDNWEVVRILVTGVSLADIDFNANRDYGYVRYQLGAEFTDAGVCLHLEYYSGVLGGPNELTHEDSQRVVMGRSLSFESASGYCPPTNAEQIAVADRHQLHSFTPISLQSRRRLGSTLAPRNNTDFNRSVMAKKNRSRSSSSSIYRRD